jgi:hypothetical protein
MVRFHIGFHQGITFEFTIDLIRANAGLFGEPRSKPGLCAAENLDARARA